MKNPKIVLLRPEIVCDDDMRTINNIVYNIENCRDVLVALKNLMFTNHNMAVLLVKHSEESIDCDTIEIVHSSFSGKVDVIMQIICCL